VVLVVEEQELLALLWLLKDLIQQVEVVEEDLLDLQSLVLMVVLVLSQSVIKLEDLLQTQKQLAGILVIIMVKRFIFLGILVILIQLNHLQQKLL
jgi:hypothetical protein